jgi:Cof subfamily protein (haloacid dehalogenase superfamily)
MMPRIALLLADVDGTLVTQQKMLTEETKAAVAALRDAGIRFAVTSGRPPRGMAMLIDPLAIDTPLAGFNGGVFVNPDLSVIAELRIPPDVVTATLAALPDYGLDAWLYTGTEWLVTRADGPHVEHESWTVKFDAVVVEHFTDAQLKDAAKIVGVSDDLDAVAKCEAALQQQLGSRASATRSQPYYLDITHADANKGGVVKELSHRLGIPTERIATIGDMPNDVLMFRASGFSIAMGNASAEVRQAASTVTDTNEHDGLAKAIRRHILTA